MMAWKKLSTWYTRLRDDSGVVKKVSLGTSHRKTAERMEAIFAVLRDQGDGWAVNAMVHGTATPLRVFNAVAEGRRGLDALRRELDETDLSVHAAAWERWVSRHASPETVTRYVTQLNVLFTAVGMSNRDLSRKNVSEALLAMDVSGTTVRHYHAAWSSFFNYLLEIGAVEDNPMHAIKAPKPNPAKDLWLELTDVIRLVDAHEEPFRSLAAFREGAGVEVSAALRVRVRDVDLSKRTVRARGTKRNTRDRLVRVDEWAIGRLSRAVMGKMPDALVWPIMDDQGTDPHALELASGAVYRALKRALKALPDLPQKYTVHDARHSYAVRHVKEHGDYQRIANNLGHTTVSQVINIYGKYRLKDEEIEAPAPVLAPDTSDVTSIGRA